MKHIVKIITLIVLFPSLSFGSGMKGKFTKTKTIDKTYTINSNGTVKLNNKYGSIVIDTWSKNEVNIKVIITTNGNNEDKVDDKLKNIDVQFENNSSLVSAKTTFDKNKKSSWNFFGKSNNNVNMNIKYIVKMPSSCNLDSHMDYGDIILDRLEGKAILNCDYGNIIVGELFHSSNTINLDYSPGSTIDSMNDGTINIDYSTITIDNARNISLNSDYSNTTFESLNNLNFNADYGNIIAHNIKNVEGNGDYVNLKFGKIENSIVMNSDYGSLKVEKMGQNFSLIDLDTEYTGVKIGVDGNSSFSLVAESQYGGIRLPEGFNFTKQIEKNNKKHYEGNYNGSKGKIIIRSQYGGIKIYIN